MFPNGLCSAGTVYDEVTPTKAIKRVGSVALDSFENYGYQSHIQSGTNAGSGYMCYPIPNDMKNTISAAQLPNAICSTYPVVISNEQYHGHADKSLSYFNGYPNILFIADSSASTNATTFKESLTGDYLYYELSEPIEVPFTKTLGYAVQPGGTEQLLPGNQPGQTPDTTQIIMDVTYPLDAVGTLQNLPNNYTSLQVMDNFASSLAQALTSAVGATTITRNSNGTWTITITPAS